MYKKNICRKCELADISYTIARDEQKLINVLEYHLGFDLYPDGSEMKIFCLVIIKELVDMLTQEGNIFITKEEASEEIIDVLNDVINGVSLKTWLHIFKGDWENIYSELQVKDFYKYLRYFIWFSLNEFRFKPNIRRWEECSSAKKVCTVRVRKHKSKCEVKSNAKRKKTIVEQDF